MNRQPFIDANSAFDAYEESRKWYRPYFEPVDEFERIARNRPSDRIDPTLPRITDGTVAAVVQEGPKRVIQQLTSGIVECREYPEYAKMADLVLRYRLVPMYCRQGDALQKSWNMLGKALTYGKCTSFSFFTTTNNQFHVDYIIPYVKDVLGEKGKVYAPDSNIRFVRAWYQKRDLQAIIDREKALAKQIKGYKTEWNLKGLADVMNVGGTAKPAEYQTPAEREKGGDGGGFQIIHCFQSGKGAEFYSFAVNGNKSVPLRTKVNPDPRGLLPLDDLYCNIDLSNPLGRGVVELSGGLQNLIDQQMQMFQFMTTYQQAPALKVWGTVNKASLKIRPNAIWDMGTNPTNKIERDEIDNSAVANFSNNYALLKSQLFNLNNSQDHSISAEAGNPSQSKTQAGVKAAEARLGVSDNYLRKQFEAWDQAQKETAINLYFAERSDQQTMKLEGDDLRDIKASPAAKFLQQDGQTLAIPYKKINQVSFKFTVDPSSSAIKQDADAVEKLTNLYELIVQDPDPNIQGVKTRLIKAIIDESGIEGAENIMPTDEQGNPQQDQSANLQQQIVPMVQQIVQQMLQEQQGNNQPDPVIELMKALKMNYADLPPDARQVVLAHTGLTDGQPNPADPVQQKQHLDSLKTLTEVDNTVHSQQHQAKQLGLQAQQQQSQMQQQQAQFGLQVKQHQDQTALAKQQAVIKPKAGASSGK